MLVNLLSITMNDITKLDPALKDSFLNKERFAEEIELLVSTSNMNYIDAIVEYCVRNNVELESVSKLMSKPLKEKLRYDATELNYLKRTSRGKLPF